MRHIDKNQASPQFSNFVKKKLPKQWHELYLQDKDIYKEACEALLEEQSNMCGYTEIYFRDKEKGHIDHYIKRSIDNRKTFDWNNLIYATKDAAYGANYKDKVIKKEDYCNIFNPVTDYPEDYFEYSYLGEILPKHGIDASHYAKAEKTIEMFNLNHKSLCSKRRNAAISIDELKKNKLAKDEIIEYLREEGFDSIKTQLLK